MTNEALLAQVHQIWVRFANTFINDDATCLFGVIGVSVTVWRLQENSGMVSQVWQHFELISPIKVRLGVYSVHLIRQLLFNKIDIFLKYNLSKDTCSTAQSIKD